MQSQYQIHNLEEEKSKIQANNIELEMELQKAWDEIDKLNTILENYADTATIKTIDIKNHNNA